MYVSKIYSPRCKQYTGNKNPHVLHTANGNTMIIAYCCDFNNKKSKFTNEQDVKRLVSSLGL